jgi:carboxyl-terminal processing protease
LDQVADMLSYFVPAWEKTVITKYYNWENFYKSRWYDLIDFSKYKLIFLENGWTASASEIFIGTIKDYYPQAKIIWEKSYWKGSVQTIKTYSDGSALKYTIAKWFTWKTHTWIDGIWIKPDIEIKMDKYWVDEYKDKQLQRALRE